MNVWDYLIIGAIVAALIVAVIVILKNKKKGKCACGCDCANCAGCANFRKDHK